MPKIPLEGTYCKQGPYIISNTARFVIGKRQKIAPNKPLHYMTYKPLSGGGKGIYVSSLYPSDNGTFTVEYEGVNYHYIDKGDTVHIIKVCGNVSLQTFDTTCII